MKNPVKLFFLKMFNKEHAPDFTGDVQSYIQNQLREFIRK